MLVFLKKYRRMFQAQNTRARSRGGRVAAPGEKSRELFQQPGASDSGRVMCGGQGVLEFFYIVINIKGDILAEGEGFVYQPEFCGFIAPGEIVAPYDGWVDGDLMRGEGVILEVFQRRHAKVGKNGVCQLKKDRQRRMVDQVEELRVAEVFFHEV
jgi:hypothetical protein